MKKTGIELIAQERKEQIEKHGRTIERDVHENCHVQLRSAAQALLSPHESERMFCLPYNWSKEIWEKMARKDYNERLIIAGALIAAEIDRLQNS